MNNSEKPFNPQESLALITSMIESARHSFSDKGQYYLLWGWSVLIGCIIQYTMLEILQHPKHYYAWLIIPVTMIIFFIMLFREKKRPEVKTFVSEANGYLWMTVGLSYIPLIFILTAMKWQVSPFPFYILLYGIGTAISGALLKFKPLRYGGMACLALAGVAAFLPYGQQILLTAIAILISYIIPGHLLRRHYQLQKRAAHG